MEYFEFPTCWLEGTRRYRKGQKAEVKIQDGWLRESRQKRTTGGITQLATGGLNLRVKGI